MLYTAPPRGLKILKLTRRHCFRGAGTAADVFVELVGSQGSTRQMKLDNAPDNFCRGKSDMFNLSSRPLGCLEKLRLALVPQPNDAEVAPWHLQSIHAVHKVSMSDTSGEHLGSFEYDGWVHPGEVRTASLQCCHAFCMHGLVHSCWAAFVRSSCMPCHTPGKASSSSREHAPWSASSVSVQHVVCSAPADMSQLVSSVSR